MKAARRGMLGILALLALAISRPAAAAGAEEFVVTYVSGEVNTVPKSGGAAQPLAAGARLAAGDVVQTGADGRAEVELSTGSLLRLGEGTRLELGQSARPQVFSARLAFGNLWAKVHKLLGDESFEVETTNGVAGVRGTEFQVGAGASGDEHLLRVFEGVVEVKDHGGGWVHLVAAGSELHFARAQKPLPPRAIPAGVEKSDKFIGWVRERSEERKRPGSVKPPAERPQDKVKEGQRKPEERDDKRDERKKKKHWWRR